MTRMLFVILSMAFSTNLPSPIFPVYQTAYGLSTAMITVLFAVYAVGVLLMLLAGGALAERMGPRSIALLGVGLAGVSALVFLLARGPAALFAGRLLSGLAVGAFMGTSNTLLLQMTTPDQRDRILGFSASLNLFGFGLGPALGGVWVRFSPGNAMWAPFVVLVGVLAAAFLAVVSIRLRDEAPTSSGRVPFRLGVPSEGRALFWGVVGPAIFAAFGFGGIAFALLPGLARSVLGPAGRGIGGLLIFLITTAGALAQLLPKPASSQSRLAWGLGLLGVGSWFVIFGESRAIPIAVLAAAIVQGIGNGWTFQASLRLAGALAARGERIRVMSTYFVCGYAGLSLPAVATGELSRSLGVVPSMEVTGIFLSLVLLLAISLARRASLPEAS
ncbi:MAG TPA: MFS transporter [Spirochaetia bacterium]|nr:MFS transporter [Spirochaetia bacterium]